MYMPIGESVPNVTAWAAAATCGHPYMSFVILLCFSALWLPFLDRGGRNHHTPHPDLNRLGPHILYRGRRPAPPV